MADAAGGVGTGSGIGGGPVGGSSGMSDSGMGSGISGGRSSIGGDTGTGISGGGVSLGGLGSGGISTNSPTTAEQLANSPTTEDSLSRLPTTADQLSNSPATGQQLANSPSVIAEQLPNNPSAIAEQIAKNPVSRDSAVPGNIPDRSNNAGSGMPPMSAPVWVAGSVISEHGKGILRANPELKVQWSSTTNLNREAGFTKGMQALLQEKGIEVDDEIRNRPSSVVSNEPKHRTANGNAARDAIAAEFNQSGNRVRTEVAEQTPIQTEKRPSGLRKVDVVVETPGTTPEKAIRLDIESKLGRVGLDSETRTQVDKDAWRLSENARLRTWGGRLDVAGKVVKPVGIVLDAATIAQSARAEGGFGPATQRVSAGVAGGATGGAASAWAGAAIGASIGSVVPFIGTAVGGVIGGIFGALAGSWGGEAAAHAAYDAARR